MAEPGRHAGPGGSVEGGGCGGIGVRREVLGEVGSPAGVRAGEVGVGMGGAEPLDPRSRL